MKSHVVLGSLAAMMLGCAAAGAVIDSPAQTAAANSPAGAQAAPDTMPTRDQIIKEGPDALEHNCTKCHGSDKWEGTNRDRDGWAAIVASMQGQMAQAQMPPLNERTVNVIIGYLALTHPQ
jgi:Spy/CpxP family protein refolding chaperone